MFDTDGCWIIFPKLYSLGGGSARALGARGQAQLAGLAWPGPQGKSMPVRTSLFQAGSAYHRPSLLYTRASRFGAFYRFFTRLYDHILFFAVALRGFRSCGAPICGLRQCGVVECGSGSEFFFLSAKKSISVVHGFFRRLA